MDQPIVLRTTKIGGGFVKEDVIAYIDELNSKIVELTEEIEKAKGAKPASDPQEIAKYRTQIDKMQEKLNAANNNLRTLRKENDELKKQLEGKGLPAGSTAALEAAKKEIASLKAQLAAKNGATTPAQAGGQMSAQAQAALEAAKKEIESLRAQVANQKAAPAADTTALNAELTKAKQELAKAMTELKTRTEQLSAKTKESADKDSKITKLTKESQSAASETKKKDEQIASLTTEVEQLKAKLADPSAIMGTFFATAQELVDKQKKEAAEEAEKTVKDAKDKADKTVKEAEEKASKTISDAEKKASDTISDAEKKAAETITDANSKADKLNEMSSTVRSILLNEIEGINTKLTTLTETINSISSQTSDKMKEAASVIEEARKAVDTGDTLKLIDVPKIAKKEAPAPAPAPKAAAPEKKEAPAPAPKASAPAPEKPASKPKNTPPVMSGMDEIPEVPVLGSSRPKPAPAKPTPPPAPAPKKPISSLGFDMEELLKAAEAEAAKNGGAD